MSTQQTEREKQSPGGMASVPSPSTIVQEGQFPPPHPPRRPVRSKYRGWYIGFAIAIVLLLLLSVGLFAFSQFGPGKQGTQPTPTTPPSTVQPTSPPATATPPGTDQTPTPPPGVTPGPQPAPVGIGDPAYWDAIIGTNNGERSVESVSFANLMDNPSLQALVLVRHHNANRTLDVYVFDHVKASTPTRIFLLQGLIKGDAKISVYNTVMTAQVDKNSSLNAGKSVSSMTADLYQEFDWSAEEGTLVQTAFPGIFPDLTRYQAEADQRNVNKGQDSWKNDAAQVAARASKQLLQWNRSLTTKVLSGGGSKDVSATVYVEEAPIPNGPKVGPNVNVTLSRLEGNTHNMWVVISIQDGSNFTLTSIDARSQITSPVRFEGKGSAYEGEVGYGVILDHLYKNIGNAILRATGAGMGFSPYATNVSYNTTFTQGSQEGIVEAQQSSAGLSSDVATAVVFKVLLSPEPGVALGEVPCPVSVNNAQHWNAILGLNGTSDTVAGISCANMKGNPSLQALVTVYHHNTEMQDAYIFDRITDAHPVQLFKLQGLYRGLAVISNYSTIMTGEVDRDSSINQGKTGDQLTTDLFREFKWAEGSGAFEQVAFPGIFPDLTRYQAELDQRAVTAGQETWKNDPAKVAKALVAKFFDWKRPVTTKVLSGGSAQDVDARVQVQETAPQGASFSPSVVVTLSRLEGNTSNMWVAIAVDDGSMLSLKNITARSVITSPVTLKGTGAAFEAVIGKAVVYDHLSGDIGHAQVTGNNGMGQADYSTNVAYTTSYKQGVQEGIVAVYSANGGISDEIATAVMRKVMLNPGTAPGPAGITDPAYWNAFISAPPSIVVADSVTFANLLGRPNQQAMVVGHEVVGGGPVYRSVFVFDNITAQKPTLLFKVVHLLQGDAKISVYNTIMTAQVDASYPLTSADFPIGKNGNIYREFKWSDGAGTFTQTAFPGIFPDLTRYQAEADQSNVSKGQETWKNDPVQVAQQLAVKLLKWSASSQATVVSGGGSQDVDATVQVRSASPAHPTITVTLSRLEGNTHNMWVAIAVADGSFMSITSPVKWDLLSSPATVKGTGSAFEGDVGTVYVLDHRYSDIGHAKGVPASNGKTTFSATITYSATFHAGAQEGLLAYYRYSEADGAIAGAVIQKVLLGA